MRFDEVQGIEVISRKYHDLQNLVTIGSGSLAAIDSVHLFSDNTSQDPVRLYSQWVGVDIPWKAPRFLFSYDDIGGLGGVAQWLRVSEKYRHVTYRLMPNWNVSSPYVNYRFNDAYIAVETLLRIRLGREPSMKKDIIHLAKEAGNTFLYLVSDVERWAQRVVVDTRINREVHTKPWLDSSDGSSLYFLAESIVYLVVIHLLKECRVQDEVIASFKNQERFKRLAKGLERCLQS